jgi:hypothetical protein
VPTSYYLELTPVRQMLMSSESSAIHLYEISDLRIFVPLGVALAKNRMPYPNRSHPMATELRDRSTRGAPASLSVCAGARVPAGSDVV